MRKLSLTLLLLLLIFSNCSYADFRCGTHVVDIGDLKEDVLRECGPPTIETRSYGTHSHLYYDFGEAPESGSSPEDQGFIDEWIYNYGPRHFRQYLRFENGVLQETRSLSYGK